MKGCAERVVGVGDVIVRVKEWSDITQDMYECGDLVNAHAVGIAQWI